MHKSFVNGVPEGLFEEGSFATLTRSITAEKPTYAMVAVSVGMNFRSQPFIGNNVISKLPKDTAVTLLEAGEMWHKVSHNGRTGYISAEYSTLHTGEKPDNSFRAQVAQFAMQFLGVRYVWGGTNLNSGVDCSGFTQSVYRNYGIQINRVSRDQFNNGTRVTRAQLRVGDMVFFSNDKPGVVQHVGIYIGNGQFVHAASGSANRVIVSHLDEQFYRTRFLGGTNVIGERR
jgi:cell wall-associated NlpC family hydrolase